MIRGGYIVRKEKGELTAILMATGSEVALALEARTHLQAQGIATAVVSMPCWEMFDTQDDTYRASVLPAGGVPVAIEAALRFGWDRYLGERGARHDWGYGCGTCPACALRARGYEQYAAEKTA